MLPGQQGVWQLPEELFQQAGYAVDIMKEGFRISKIELIRIWMISAYGRNGVERYIPTIVKYRFQLGDMSGGA